MRSSESLYDVFSQSHVSLNYLFTEHIILQIVKPIILLLIVRVSVQ